MYIAEPAGQRAVAGLGLSGTGADSAGARFSPGLVSSADHRLSAAAAGRLGAEVVRVEFDVGSPVAFMRRSVHWRVRLSPDGAAQATAAFTPANDSPAYGLPPLQYWPVR